MDCHLPGRLWGVERPACHCAGALAAAEAGRADVWPGLVEGEEGRVDVGLAPREGKGGMGRVWLGSEAYHRRYLPSLFRLDPAVFSRPIVHRGGRYCTFSF